MLCVPLIGTLGSVFRAQKKEQRKSMTSQNCMKFLRAIENTKITRSVQNFGVKTWIGLKIHSDPV